MVRQSEKELSLEIAVINETKLELQRVDNFIETFPRRRRNLDYEIETITTWFFDELQ